MRNGLEKLEVLLSTEQQFFICINANTRDFPETQKTEIPLLHETASGLTPEQLSSYLDANYPSELFDFYSQYGSVRLFCDEQQTASGIYIAHPEEWGELRTELDAWLNELSAQEKTELLPLWLDKALVFAEIPNSSNFFIYVTQGPEAGQIFEFFHDGYEFNPIAKSLEDFISQISDVSEIWINRISSHTRYMDTPSNTQWIPEHYRSL